VKDDGLMTDVPAPPVRGDHTDDFISVLNSFNTFSRESSIGKGEG
jgi:hypothetical protein